MGAAAAAASAAPSAVVGADGQAPAAGRLSVVTFDAYGTLFDVFSVTALCEELFPASAARSRSSGASSSSNTRSCAASWAGTETSGA